MILAVMLLAGRPVFSQELAVSGQVREAGNPLPGVSILEKGTSKGTTSDAQGNFNLTVESPTAVLVFSFIGYKTQEVAVANRTVIRRRHGRRHYGVVGGRSYSLGRAKRG